MYKEVVNGKCVLTGYDCTCIPKTLGHWCCWSLPKEEKMKTIKLTKEEAFDAAEDGTLVKSSPTKYGTIESYVFDRDGIKYMFKVEIHRSEGWQIDGTVEAFKVKPVEKTIIEWVIDNE